MGPTRPQIPYIPNSTHFFLLSVPPLFPMLVNSPQDLRLRTQPSPSFSAWIHHARAVMLPVCNDQPPGGVPGSTTQDLTWLLPSSSPHPHKQRWTGELLWPGFWPGLSRLEPILPCSALRKGSNMLCCYDKTHDNSQDASCLSVVWVVPPCQHYLCPGGVFLCLSQIANVCPPQHTLAPNTPLQSCRCLPESITSFPIVC